MYTQTVRHCLAAGPAHEHQDAGGDGAEVLRVPGEGPQDELGLRADAQPGAQHGWSQPGNYGKVGRN